MSLGFIVRVVFAQIALPFRLCPVQHAYTRTHTHTLAKLLRQLCRLKPFICLSFSLARSQLLRLPVFHIWLIAFGNVTGYTYTYCLHPLSSDNPHTHTDRLHVNFDACAQPCKTKKLQHVERTDRSDLPASYNSPHAINKRQSSAQYLPYNFVLH